MRISRGARWACLTGFLLILPAAADTGQPRPSSVQTPNLVPKAARVRSDVGYGNLPSVFEPNTGQTAPEVRFLTRSPGMVVFFTDTAAVMVLHKGHARSRDRSHKHGPSLKAEREVIRMKLAGATAPRRAVGLEKLPGVSNYFRGNDPKKWRTDVPHYARILYQGVYPGIDMICHGENRQLEYDLVVQPGADPRRIELAWEGVERLRANADGDLVLATRLGELVQKRPRVYQDVGGRRVEVAASYAIRPGGRVAFELARYDRSRTLTIDPVLLVYSTYLGGSFDDDAYTIAVDSMGSAYAAGQTASTDFPTLSAFQNSYKGDYDVFVTKFSPAGNTLVYSTYLGGSGNDDPEEIAVDGAFSAYVAGATTSPDFPVASAYQSTLKGSQNAFVTKLSPAGNALVYSTYVGGSGSDYGSCTVVDAAGAAYVTGDTTSPDFPTHSAYQSSAPSGDHAFVFKLAPAGNALAYSTYLAGHGQDQGISIAVDGAGSAYVAGDTTSTDFPTQSAYQSTLKGGQNVFVTKLAPAGNALAYSTYLGGSGVDQSEGIAVDTAGSAYVTGATKSTNFPTQSPYQSTLKGGQNIFVTKLTPAGNALVYSTYLGGSGEDLAIGIQVDAARAAYITGYTTSPDFPLQSPFQATFAGGPVQHQDAYVAKLAPSGAALIYSTYLGGSGDDQANYIAVDAAGAAYVAGYTTSTDFPTHLPYQAVNRATPASGYSTAFVTKLQLPVAVATNPPGLSIAVDGVALVAPQAFDWPAGAVHTISATSPQENAGARYEFANWSDGGAQAHNITATSLATTFTASFTSEYQLTASASPTAGGIVTANPASSDGYYNSGASVQLTAAANPGYQFSGWSGDLTGTTNPQSLAMSAPHSVTATFTAVGPPITAVVDSASYRSTIAPNSFVTIYGSSFTSWTGDWSNYAPGGVLPTTLGGVQVLIDGKNCFVSYASPTQLNAVTPPDTATGSVPVEVITAQGTATSTATMAQFAPALFGYTLSSGRFYAVAQIANTATIVAPVGTFGSATPSRPAQAGDYVVLYAIGMGSTNPAAPSGQVLQTAYPVSDLSSVKVQFGTVPATVSWAGMVYAGEFQVNVQAPSGLSGDEPVVMTVGGVSTQPNAFLTFQ